ncbi:endonuclease/exonuclease/phosphatase family protein [Coleofasciculus sp. FACHB-T130]|uniref:endonuclease/exonuclease/phosphatase family protein n=1 Tax=Cyanophyceae TaxID=3028117 RepID=UPI0016851689|nr:endonuclease/exonuclease/phosphatase family protein [Coleofasciculus sp. FACHB-T130]MBD1881066.1 endonuclease/exonuclease/phosphatase family protein [Coleofasciculus sp. FACHB-T130]
MSTKLRIVTFNLENLDDKPGETPTLDERIAVMRPQLVRLNADILCLQEANGQEQPGQPRRLLALKKLLEGTPYTNYQQVSTTIANGEQVFDERNLVILSRFEIIEYQQYKHKFAPAPFYQKVTANPPETEAEKITWERPILHAKVQLPDNQVLNVINVHLKSKLPADILGQKINNSTWKTASGWAEGFFVASMKRVGQALETRILIDQLFDANEDALIVVCGDFNAEVDEVPLEAIRGDVENTGNGKLIKRVMVPCERSIPEPARFSLLHRGKGRMLDHVLVSRMLLAHYKGSEIHNELLHDESIAFATDKQFPESDHAPVIAEFELP